jgi:hypothetical protein
MQRHFRNEITNQRALLLLLISRVKEVQASKFGFWGFRDYIQPFNSNTVTASDPRRIVITVKTSNLMKLLSFYVVCVPEILSRPVIQYELLLDDLSLKSSFSAEITRVPEREMSLITRKVLKPVTECNILRLQFREDLHGIHREMKLNRCHEIQLRKNVT